MRELCLQLNYGVALNIGPDEIFITPDYLGLYPIYYYQDDSAFILTSIPGLLRCYDNFPPQLDIKGLVGILLLAHSSLGHTLFRGLSRLSSRHLLNYNLDGRVTEEEVPLNVGGAPLRNIDDAVESFDSALTTAVRSAVCQGTQ